MTISPGTRRSPSPSRLSRTESFYLEQKKSQNPARNLAVVYRIRELFPVIDVDRAVIETFSDLKARGPKTGSIVDDMDLLIAATALTYNLTLVTNNIKHFQKIEGLKIENWSKP